MKKKSERPKGIGVKRGELMGERRMRRMRRDCCSLYNRPKDGGLVWRGKAITTWIKPAERIIEREAPSKHHGKRTDRTAVNRRGDRDCSRAFNDYIRKDRIVVVVDLTAAQGSTKVHGDGAGSDSDQ